MNTYDSIYSIALAISKKAEIDTINYDSTFSIAKAIYEHLGGTETTFDSTYSIVYAIYLLNGGTEQNFDSTYSILVEIDKQLGGTGEYDDVYSVLLDILDNYSPVPVPTTYRVIYASNGGSGTMVDPNSPYEPNSVVTILANSYSREGYTFEKWNTKADGTGTEYESGDTFTITSNVTLYAQWERIPVYYTVIYSGNGGSGTVEDPNSPYLEESTVTVLANAYSKEHYDFNGWNTASDGTGTAYASGATFTITGNTTLYAQWVAVPQFTVIYNGNSGSGAMVDSNSPYYRDSVVTVLANSYTREHYGFNGWNTASDGSGVDYESGATFTITGNTTLYAQWVEDAKYTVTYNNNGGSGSMSDQNSPYYVGSTVTVLANSYTKEGYNFEKWNTAADGSGQDYATGSTFTITGDTVLYAQWEAVPVPVPVYDSAVTFTAQEDNSVLGLSALSTAHTMQYSTDAETWSNMDTATTIALNSGETAFVRGVLSAALGDTGTHTRFKMTGRFTVKGDASYVWDYNNPTASLKSACGFSMFEGCTGLTDASQLVLPALTVPAHAYRRMFYGCTSLVSAPEFPATTLGTSCYREIFRGCTSLVNAPSTLPAKTVVWDAYHSMFQGCTSLVKSPKILSDGVGNTSNYTAMFSGCTSLNEITCTSTATASGSFSNWVAGVSATGIFYKNPNVTNWGTGIHGIPSGWSVRDVSPVVFKARQNNSTVGLAHLSTNHTLQYSSDSGDTWTNMDTATTIILQSGQSIYIRGTLIGNNDTTNYTQFAMTGKIAASGDGDNLWEYQNVREGMKDYDGYRLFKDCTALTSAPNLPHTALTTDCYAYMFEGCTSLTSAPALPATALANGCYFRMFSGCSALTSVPALNATTLKTDCYREMFRDCTSLTSVPALNGTTLAERCYLGMFYGCARLTSVPTTLPATTLAEECYSQMFYNCSGITSAPALPATTLAQGCYQYMFNGCSSLNDVKCLATDISASGSTNGWLSNVSATGTFTKNASMSSWTTGDDGIPLGWTVETPQEPTNAVKFTARQNNSSVGLSAKSSNHTPQYTTDYIIWNNMTTSTNISLSSGQSVYVRGTMSGNNSTYQYTQFKMTGSIAMSGNGNNIWNYTNPDAALARTYCGNRLFSGCTALTDVSQFSLPATALTDYCYTNMFGGCTGINAVPSTLLPAMTMKSNCYQGMFENCYSLSNAPALPATTLAERCYTGMFRHTNLTSAPILPATTMAKQCYRWMFGDCTALTTPPALPATALTEDCYAYMFCGSTSLTTAPELPAETLGVTSYNCMFSGCTSLNEITCLATNISASNCTKDWVGTVAATGTFKKNASMSSWTTGNNGIPTDWTVEDYTPSE